MVTRIAAGTLRGVVEARLRTLEHVTVYVGHIDDDHPPPTLSGDTRVAPYVVLYASPGILGDETDLADDSGDILWTFQVTVVAGVIGHHEHALDRTVALFDRWEPTLTHPWRAGPTRQVNDPGPGPRIEYIEGQPPRFYTPLVYQLTAHT